MLAKMVWDAHVTSVADRSFRTRRSVRVNDTPHFRIFCHPCLLSQLSRREQLLELVHRLGPAFPVTLGRRLIG